MFRQHWTGTPEQLRTQVKSLKLPDDLPQPEAIRAFVMAHIPTYEVKPWHLTLAVESASNQGGNRIAGFISVAAMEP